jgi:glycerol-3-phosphate acyltransferase PlsX
MRIVLDAMGSDEFPEPELHAALEADKLFGDPVILVGNIDQLKPRLEALAGSNPPVKLIHAADSISMDDKGMALALKARRANSQTSMAVGLDLLKNNEADAFVTAGNTGGAMATAYYRLGALPGVERPGLTAIFPVKNGRCVVVDIGANPDCKPEHLYQFAIMGSLYANQVLGVKEPRVGIMSNGEEEGKGNQLIKETLPLLKSASLNFIGGIEGKELFGGFVDVAVADGFTGNVLLKSSEAVAKLIMETLKSELKSNPITLLGALLARPAFNKIRKMLDPAEIGAAPLLGVNGLVFIGHGRSDAHALVSAIRTSRQAVKVGLLASLQKAIQQKPVEVIPA